MKFFLSGLGLFLVILSPALSAPLKVCLVSGSEEYHSDESLATYEKYLEERYNVDATLIKAIGFEQLPGLEALDNCDVALFFTRRLRIDGEELERVKKYCLSGKPIVAVRTASHGFQNWLEFDKIVLGGSYQGHYGDQNAMKAEIVPNKKDHPILQGIDGEIRSRYSLYRTAPVAQDAEVLMVGSTLGQPQHPAAWARIHNGGRVFYTSLGGPEDFENASFQKLIANALYWAAERPVEAKELPQPERRTQPQGTFKLPLRTRVETPKGSGNFKEEMIEREFPIAETAILICDMWDKHWCRGATERCGVIAENMASLVSLARDKGIQIIHSPSDTMNFYMDTLQRRRIQLASKVEMPEPKKIENPPLPIDDSDGGCDTGDPMYIAWTRQHKAIPIAEPDGISDNGQEIYNFMEQEGIKNVLIMGVHTNMCVMNRSFAICAMTRLGKQYVLVRDFTDTMYDPKDPPHVSHDQGTELVVQHIEKYWCPSALSEDIVNALQ